MNDLLNFCYVAGDDVQAFVRCFILMLSIEFIAAICGLIGKSGR